MRTVPGTSGPVGSSPAVRPATTRTRPTVARPDHIRRHNLALVLREVHRDGALDRLAVAAVTGGGTVRWRHVRVLGPDQRSARAVTRLVADVVCQATEELGGASWPIGVGVSVPGTVRTGSGFVEDAPNLDW